MILEFSRRQANQVGSNVEGAAAPPLWVYLLPSLEQISPCSLGDVSSEVLRGLASWEPVTPLVSGAPIPLRCRLLLIGPEAASHSAMRSLLYSEMRRPAIWAEAAAAADISAELGSPLTWWFLPDKSPRRSLREQHFPDANGSGTFPIRIPSMKSSHGKQQRALRIAARALRRLGIQNGLGRSKSMTTSPLIPGGAPRSSLESEGALFLSAAPDHPPEWLLDTGRLSEVELGGRDWSILPPRGFRSQKVSFFFGSKSATAEPDPIVIKMTQAAEFNARLLNEHRALSLLNARGDFPANMIPRPLFSGSHRGLALIAQTRLPGDAFTEHSTGGADCPVAARALEVIHTLSVGSSRPASGAAHADAISGLLRRFRDAYQPGNELVQVAEKALQDLSKLKEVPTVFLHGDPEPQNLIVGKNGEIALLDWENAEIEGPPLWDHFSFLISYARFSLERSGIRPTSAAAAHRLFSPSSWSDLMARSTATLTARLQMSEAAVEPLLILHAAAMSIRELWRLPQTRLRRGMWIRWMGEVVRNQDRSPVLAALRRPASHRTSLR